MKSKKIVFSFSVRGESEDFIKKVKNECKRKGVSFSWLIVEALKKYFETE